ncbi:MAG: FAD-dependent oxidoreductase, partial [Actinomycetota bacterium]|nr:FAD-dependent oxidoreductase [Actinomycetota bacterium]
EDHHGGEGTGTTWKYLPDGTAVGIPLSTLVVRDGVNVLAAGRCFSASHDAQASVRSMAQCMAMGHAAGTAAALALAHSGALRQVPTREIQNRLRTGGAILEIERS